MPVEVGSQVDGGLGLAGADDEAQARVIECLQVARGEHAGIGHDDHVGDLVAFLERLDHRDDGVGFGLVSLERVDLQREPGPVDQQPDNDLRIDPAFFRVADFAGSSRFVGN